MYLEQESANSALNSLLVLCMDEKNQQLIVKTVLLIESLLTAKKDFKFDSYERVLAFLLDKLPDSKLGKKSE